ncbi:flavin monoamine oxidase family protein [Nocardioides stalactiti]|uniref:flavin monoamine oxidase family protein n=1 Tax=Nocardioides stalactiti TaxID=2755356 RepID=UPI0028B22A06|nr:NAD(P)/FAD-dependent oxidoreductase [Nocardioides stalactiti]
MRIGVVGAGLAGLVCAWRLHREGHDVVVLEARDRVGGRTWSTALPDGTVVERGGEWIDADQHTIRGLCAELGLPLAPHGVRFHRRRLDGVVPDLAALEATLTAVAAQIPEDDTTVAAAFAAALGPGYAADPAYLRIATSTAGDPARASARFHVARADGARVDAAARVVGGNQRICLSMAAELGDRVRLATPVTAVDARDDDVVLTTGGREEVVDRAVVAVPLALLEHVRWIRGFPAAWQRGLDGIATGTAAKLSVPTRGAVAPDGVQAPGESWWSWTSRDPAGDGAVTATSCFAGSAAARDRLAVADGPATWVDRLATLRPDLDLVAEQALLTDWQREEWTRGGYSYVLAGRAADAAALLAEPAGPLVLAGEHTAGAHSGTMEGALRSGVRAAQVAGTVSR